MTVLCNCLSLSDCLFVRYFYSYTHPYTNRLAEDGSPEAARKTLTRRVGGYRQQTRRVGPSFGQSRKGVSLPFCFWREIQVSLCGRLTLICLLLDLSRIEEDDLIQREVHNADLSNHDRGCIIQ